MESNKFVMLSAFGKEDVSVVVSTAIILDEDDDSELNFPENDGSITQDYLYVPFPIVEKSSNNTKGFLCYYSKNLYKWRLWNVNKAIPTAHKK